MLKPVGRPAPYKIDGEAAKAVVDSAVVFLNGSAARLYLKTVLQVFYRRFRSVPWY